MFAQTLTALLLLGSHSLVKAMPADDELVEGLEGYDVVPAVWDIETSPGNGDYVTLTGPIEKVYPELLAINPNYDQEYNAYIFDHPEEKEEEEDFKVALDKRTDFSTSKYTCRGKNRECDSGEVRKGIKHLRGVKGNPRLAAGKCSRVSCAYTSAIYWCNDSKGKKTLNTFGSIADGAQYLISYCGRSGGLNGMVGGQIWHPTKWSVIVKYPGGQCP